MFTPKTPSEPNGLQKVIDALEARLLMTQPETDEYPKMVEQLTKLHKLNESNSPKRLSPDVVATIAGNLAGILMILSYERANVVTSKALSFVLKLR
jgi:hypothetical protein